MNENVNLSDLNVNLDDLELSSASVGLGLAHGAGSVIGRREAEDEHEHGDYIDHLQQPGNTKKRKVPANASSSPGGHDTGPGSSAEQDEPTDGGIPTGWSEQDPADVYHPPPPFALLRLKKSKLTAATLAGLQHKEMLKGRKRQLAAVLGALSHGDTLALDQALSGNYPFASSGFDDIKNADQPRVRLSRRRPIRLIRSMRRTRLPRHPDEIAFPVCDFTFVSPSASE